MLGEDSRQFESAIAELHQRIDRGELEGLEDMNKAIAGLEIELNAQNGIPTWPRQPKTVNLLITALSMPLGLWLVRFFLPRLLGG